MLGSVDLGKIHAVREEYFLLDHALAAASFASSKIVVICLLLLPLVMIEVLAVANFHYLISQFNGS